MDIGSRYDYDQRHDDKKTTVIIKWIRVLTKKDITFQEWKVQSHGYKWQLYDGIKQSAINVSTPFKDKLNCFGGLIPTMLREENSTPGHVNQRGGNKTPTNKFWHQVSVSVLSNQKV